MEDFKLDVSRHNTKEDIVSHLEWMGCFSGSTLREFENNDKEALISNVSEILGQLLKLAE